MQYEQVLQTVRDFAGNTASELAISQATQRIIETLQFIHQMDRQLRLKGAGAPRRDKLTAIAATARRLQNHLSGQLGVGLFTTIDLLQAGSPNHVSPETPEARTASETEHVEPLSGCPRTYCLAIAEVLLSALEVLEKGAKLQAAAEAVRFGRSKRSDAVTLGVECLAGIWRRCLGREVNLSRSKIEFTSFAYELLKDLLLDLDEDERFGSVWHTVEAMLVAEKNCASQSRSARQNPESFGNAL